MGTIELKKKFRALWVEEKKGEFMRSIVMRTIGDLPENELLIKVYYSSLNYKDALSASGNKGITKKYPHTPGIDAVGIVEHSVVNDFQKGDRVIVTSYDLGMNTPGGFGEYIRVPASWAVKLPENMGMKESMVIGTAGFTAATCVYHLSEKVSPKDGKIIVSGASGGVGSMSVALLNQLGYEVVAISGKTKENNFLKQLGAKEIISRIDFQDKEVKPLLSAIYAGGVDTIGGVVLENIIKSVKQYGVVVCCGNVASPELNLTVYPFILRGISLVGVSTQNYPMDKRKVIWEKLATDWKLSFLSDLQHEISLDELTTSITEMLQGAIKGRTVIKMIQ
jgi:putative YhdH/YhfP family quinone oxidoreductase